MAAQKTVLAIVNRTFKHDSPIGDGLLQLAETTSTDGPVYLITQAKCDLKRELYKVGRGHGLHVYACKAFTNSASGLIKRIAESIYFMLWAFISLVRTRPTSVYVATDPPVLVPFVVAIYCRLFNAKYVYHLQDIHPEAANIVVPLNGLVMKLLLAIDNYTLRHAKALVTLSENMKSYLLKRSNTQSPIYLLDNPSFDIASTLIAQRTKDIVFCGNAGRLQRIPLLITAIRDYLLKGGKLRFTFCGGGVHAPEIKALADAYVQVDYLGIIPASDAAKLVKQHLWALLPIDDEVTKYAFPSKSSSYALSGAGVLAVCGENTSVARWVEQHEVGLVCAADHDALVSCFFSLESNTHGPFMMSHDMRAKLQIPYFAQQLSDIIFT